MRPRARRPARRFLSLFLRVLLVFRVRSFSESFDRAKLPVPLSGELSHRPGGLVEAVGLYLIQNFPARLRRLTSPASSRTTRCLETAWRENDTRPASQLATPRRC